MRINDYNIDYLRYLKNENISLDQLHARYQNADKKKPLFDQIFLKEANSMKKQENIGLLSSSPYTLLNNNRTNSKNDKPPEIIIKYTPRN